MFGTLTTVASPFSILYSILASVPLKIDVTESQPEKITQIQRRRAITEIILFKKATPFVFLIFTVSIFVSSYEVIEHVLSTEEW